LASDSLARSTLVTGDDVLGVARLQVANDQKAVEQLPALRIEQ
jgi:hypothetical protein